MLSFHFSPTRKYIRAVCCSRYFASVLRSDVLRETSRTQRAIASLTIIAQKQEDAVYDGNDWPRLKDSRHPSYSSPRLSLRLTNKSVTG